MVDEPLVAARVSGQRSLRAHFALSALVVVTVGCGVVSTLREAGPAVVSALAWQAAQSLADEAELSADTPLAVSVVHDGGSSWLTSALTAGVAAEPRFATHPSPHLVRAEVIEQAMAVGLRLKLARRGWELAPTKVWIAWVAPWLVGLVLSICLILARWRWWAWPVAGALAQCILYFGLNAEAWRQLTGLSPLRLGVTAISRELAAHWPTSATSWESAILAIVAAALAFWGLAQETRMHSPKLALRTFIVLACTLAGTLALIEAAASSGLLAVSRGMFGAIALLGTLGLSCAGWTKVVLTLTRSAPTS